MMVLSCVAEIPTPKNWLVVKGYKIAVDFDDFEKVSCLSWEVIKRSDTYIYFRARLRGVDPETGEKLYKKKVYLHRYIMGITDPSVVVDHINGNTLDNRKENLRVCTVAENNCNRTNKRNSTGYKGVRKDGSKEKPYTARIQHKRKVYLLGSFASPEEAHEAYCAKAKELHGEFWQPKMMW